MQPNNQQPVQTSQQKKKWYTTWWGILLIIFVYIPIGLVVFIMVFAIANYEDSGSDSSQGSQQQPSIHFIDPQKEITDTRTVGTQYIIVDGYLLNDTSEEGRADCNVEFYDHELNWAGGKGLGARTLKPGERYNFTLQVEVKHTGLVSKQGINCEQQ